MRLKKKHNGATFLLLLKATLTLTLTPSDWTISDPEFAALEDLVKTNNWELFLTRKLVGGTWS